MLPSEVEKIFRAFAEERKRALPQFTPDGIPITMENKFDDAIYNYLYAYRKEQSGEYDPKKDVIPESEMNKMHPKTKNEFQFEKWLFEQYGMTKKEERGYTLEGNLESLWEIFSAADMVLFARGLPSIGKELAQLGKKAVDDVAEEAVEETVKREVVGETVEKTVKTEVTEEVVENTAKKEVADTAEDLSQKTVRKDDVLEDSSVVKGNNGTNRGTLTGKLDGLKQDEKNMVEDLLNSGKNVEIIPRSNIPNEKTPDFLVDGVKTELKTLNGTSLNTPVTRIQDGFEQGAQTVIIDGRKTGLTLEQANTVISRALGKYGGNLPGKIEIWTNEGIIRR